MFKNIYTTHMSSNGKILSKRFEKINSKPMKFGKIAILMCTVLIAATFLLSSIAMAQLASEPVYTLDITNNGEIIEFENKPFIEDGEVYVPLRELFTKLGFMTRPEAKMEWNNGTILIYLVEENLNEESKGTYTAYMYKIAIGKSELVINPMELVQREYKNATDAAEPMNNAPLLRNNITYVPFSYAERMVERADYGLLSPPDRYKLGAVYSGVTLSIAYPIDGYYEITQAFGKRVHPITGEELFHTGIDFKAEEGTDVKAGMSGKVTDNGFDEEKGNYVVIQNENGVEFLYAHLSQITIRAGYEVEADDVVGKVGNTGKSTGPHLHMEVKFNGEYVNPELYLEESYYDKLLVTLSRTILNKLESEGYPDPDYKIIDIEYNMEAFTPSAVVKVQLKNYDDKIVNVLYTYYDSMNMWMVSGIIPDSLVWLMLS